MLRLGSGTGSVFNHLDSRSVKGEPTPYVGMGATTLHWTDRHACTIHKVEEIHGVIYITVTNDITKRIDTNGMSESQNYEYAPNPEGYPLIFKKHPETGFWKQCEYNAGTKRYRQLRHGCGLKIGVRDEYYDYSF